MQASCTRQSSAQAPAMRCTSSCYGAAPAPAMAPYMRTLCRCLCTAIGQILAATLEQVAPGEQAEPSSFDIIETIPKLSQYEP